MGVGAVPSAGCEGAGNAAGCGSGYQEREDAEALFPDDVGRLLFELGKKACTRLDAADLPWMRVVVARLYPLLISMQEEQSEPTDTSVAGAGDVP